MSQVAAIFLDGYRELNAKKLFWFTLILTGLAVVIVGVPTIGKDGFYLLWWKISGNVSTEHLVGDRAKLYRMIFQVLGVNIWLTWVATGLALVSTAGIFPDLITSGSIDLVLSKPIGRVKLFFSKYLTGLIFVALQVSVFCVAGFLMMGLRAGIWMPGVFLAVPLVVLFYSYLFSFCVLLGLLTRSTITALIVTIILWAILGVVNYVDWFAGINKALFDSQVRAGEKMLAHAPPAAQTRPKFLQMQQELEQVRSTRGVFEMVQMVCLVIKAPAPKTAETVDLLTRAIISKDEVDADSERARKRVQEQEEEMLSDREDELVVMDGHSPPATAPDSQATTGPASRPVVRIPRFAHVRQLGPDKEAIDEMVQGRSLWWTIGTSVTFEVIALGLALWIFCRRDY